MSDTIGNGENDNAKYNYWVVGLEREGGCLDKVSTGTESIRLDGTADSQLSFYTLSLSPKCGRRGLVCHLSLGGDLDYAVRRGGELILQLKDTHTDFSLLSQITSDFPPSTSHCAPPQGNIMSRACDKEPHSSSGGGSGGGGWEQTVRLAGPASAGVFLYLPLSLSD